MRRAVRQLRLAGRAAAAPWPQPAAQGLACCRGTQPPQQPQPQPQPQPQQLGGHHAAGQHRVLHSCTWAPLLRAAQCGRLVGSTQSTTRCFAADAPAKRRLAQAQARRQREAELADRRAAAAAPPPAATSSSSSLVAAQPSEVLLQQLAMHDALVVTRSIEWGQVLLGFEQATKYSVFDRSGQLVAIMAEEITGVGNALQRQLLRSHRSFQSTVLSPDGGTVLFRVRRPAYLVNSHMVIEDAQGATLGEVRQRWHPWRRRYELFIGKRQFAAIEGGFLAWEFELKDAAGNSLALIDRNFTGFARELFTDAGQYVVHFGYSQSQAQQITGQMAEAQSQQCKPVAVTALARVRTDVAVIPSMSGSQLVVAQPLPLSERLVALAAAISVDYNYFSKHSSGSGFFAPPILMPLPGTGGGAAAGGEAAGTAGGAAAAGGEAAGTAGGAAAAGGEGTGSAGGAAAASSEAAGAAEGLSGGEAAGSFSDAGSSSGDAGGFGSFGGGGGEPESFQWDLPGGGGDGGEGDSPGGLWGLLLAAWALIFPD